LFDGNIKSFGELSPVLQNTIVFIALLKTHIKAFVIFFGSAALSRAKNMGQEIAFIKNIGLQTGD
jgi:hypothetical protein